MRAVVQRVERAALYVVDPGGDRRDHAAIGPGLVVLLGIEQRDTDADARWMAGKVAHLRVFEDDAGRMNLAMADLDPPGRVLVAPNFTVAGGAHKGRRPDFTNAMKPPDAEAMFKLVCGLIEGEGIGIARGVFGGDMRVELVNDGPVTIVVESPG